MVCAQTSFVCSKAKKNIFLIGDSIRIGYSETVKKEPADAFFAEADQK